jgi:DNA-binding transcriptional regulator YhcF (GntR family)
MFVATGARSRLLERRREDFARQFVAPLMTEAHKLGIEPDYVRKLIDVWEEDQ